MKLDGARLKELLTVLDETTERVAEGIEGAIDGLIERWADDRSAQHKEQLKAQNKEHLTIQLLN